MDQAHPLTERGNTSQRHVQGKWQFAGTQEKTRGGGGSQRRRVTGRQRWKMRRSVWWRRWFGSMDPKSYRTGGDGDDADRSAMEMRNKAETDSTGTGDVWPPQCRAGFIETLRLRVAKMTNGLRQL
ncbi:hypothetical protein E2542_SST14921 [Spatholobus suberectus]|nr:hypothetical protein E2542_SST14921 [Spatholobus suberectus]